MSKRQQYYEAKKAASNVRRKISKILRDDLACWSTSSPPVQNKESESGIVSELTTEHEKQDTVPDGAEDVCVCPEIAAQPGGQADRSDTNTTESQSQVDNSCEIFGSDLNQSSSLVHVNFDFTDASHECESTEAESTSPEVHDRLFGHLTVVFDCDICINCRCGVCEGCQHIDGTSCKHCDLCIINVDSDAEDGQVSSEGEEGEDERQENIVGDLSLDLNVSEAMSESEKLHEDMKNDFIDIVLEHNVSQVVIHKMLKFFRKYNVGNFPAYPSSLLRTPSMTKIISVPPGEYWHRGIEADIIKYVKSSACAKVYIEISVDGVPLFTSSGDDFYPICVSLNNSPEVFLVGVYFGKGKPKDCNQFLTPFVEEMNKLVREGVTCDGKHSSVEVYTVVCDAVAKSWLLSVKGCGGYFSCCKCTVEGKRIGNRTAFLEMDCPLRTDESFVLQHQEDHHTGETILTSLISFRPVTNVVLDYLHLVLLGAMRKIMYMLLAGPKKCRQSAGVIERISAALVRLSSWVPSDFARRSRSLTFVKRSKATEWRLILFYLGPIVFRSALPKCLYEHFLILHVAMIILSHQEYLDQYVDYANDLLRSFVKHFQNLYGKEYVSHNIHNLIHLADDCKIHGVVDNFSAFKYENFYQKLKKMVRKTERPLQQLARRYEEQKKNYVERGTAKCFVPLSGCHTNGPLPPWCMNPQFSVFQGIGRNSLKLSTANNCCFLLDGSVVVVENFAILKSNQSKVMIGKKFSCKDSLYKVPCESSLFDISFVSNLSDSLSSWPLDLISRKMFRMPFKNGFAVFPLLHSDFQNA